MPRELEKPLSYEDWWNQFGDMSQGMSSSDRQDAYQYYLSHIPKSLEVPEWRPPTNWMGMSGGDSSFPSSPPTPGPGQLSYEDWFNQIGYNMPHSASFGSPAASYLEYLSKNPANGSSTQTIPTQQQPIQQPGQLPGQLPPLNPISPTPELPPLNPSVPTVKPGMPFAPAPSADSGLSLDKIYTSPNAYFQNPALGTQYARPKYRGVGSSYKGLNNPVNQLLGAKIF